MNNQLAVIGRIGQNPKIRTFGDSDNKVVKFSIDVTEYSSKKDEETTLWIDVDAWNGLGDRVLKTITKGREVLLTGRLAINVYPRQEGDKTIEVHKPVLKLTSFHLCGPKPQEVEEAPVQEPGPGCNPGPLDCYEELAKAGGTPTRGEHLQCYSSSREEVSPTGKPNSQAFNKRRIILPLRVLGNVSLTEISRG